MSKPKTDPKPDKRPKDQHNKRYAWTDDDIPLLDINSPNVKKPKK